MKNKNKKPVGGIPGLMRDATYKLDGWGHSFHPNGMGLIDIAHQVAIYYRHPSLIFNKQKARIFLSLFLQNEIERCGAREAFRRSCDGAASESNEEPRRSWSKKTKPAPSENVKKQDGRAKRLEFYLSDEWRAVRYTALRGSRGVCELCGIGPAPGKPLHVDHIKPRSRYPELELALTNLQVLCVDCNLGKSNRDEIDWRVKVPA